MEHTEESINAENNLGRFIVSSFVKIISQQECQADLLMNALAKGDEERLREIQIQYQNEVLKRSSVHYQAFDELIKKMF